MPYIDVPAFMLELRKRPGSAACALDLLIHTALRTSEVLNSRWSEIDAKLWTISAERMKAGKAHRVPLTNAAVALLEALPRSSEFLFRSTGSSDKPLSNMAMTMVLQRMGLRDSCTVLGFRSSFRHWCHEQTSLPRDIAEQALAHEVGSEVERAYRRSDGLARRRELTGEWLTYLNSSPWALSPT